LDLEPLPTLRGLSGRARLASLAGLAAFFLAFSIQYIWAADLWWQLRTGQWIVSHFAFPAHDVFSYTAADHPWIEMRWLYCVLAYLAWQAGGATLLILGQTAVLAAAFIVLAHPSRRAAVTPMGILLVALAVWAASGRFVVRPELVSYLMLPVFLVMLEAVRGGRLKRAGLALPLLQVLWTNAHTLFILGPVLAWGFVLGEAARVVLRRMGVGTASARTESGAGGRGRFPAGLHAGTTTREDSRGISSQTALSDDGAGGGSGGSGLDGNHGTGASPVEGVLPRMVWIAALVTVACLVNPYFVRGAAFPFILFREIRAGSILAVAISEFRSPFSIAAWTWDYRAAAALAAATALTFVINRRRTDPVRLGIWAAFLYLACVAVRNIGLFSYIAAWAALRNLDEIVESRPLETARARTHAQSSDPGTAASRVGTKVPGTSRASAAGGMIPIRRVSHLLSTPAHAALAILLFAAAWWVVSGRCNARYGCEQRPGFGVVPCNTPEAATRFVLDSGASPQLFHSMADGSYLAWAAQDRFPVFVDGRLEVYGESFIADYLNVPNLDWDGFADRWKINTVMLHREHLFPLLARIRASSRWVLVHLDARDLVFVRDIPAHAALIRKYRIDPGAPWVPREPEPDERPSAWRRLIGSAVRPWYSIGMAQTFLSLDSPANAARYLERATALGEDDPDLQLSLARVYLRSGDYARAAVAYRNAIRGLRPTPSMWFELGRSLHELGDLTGAEEAYGQALRLDPSLYEAHYSLGVIETRRGARQEAIAHFEAALRARPGDESARRALAALAGGS
jgi:tetratricopeptide (TPR) repeat protein